MAHKVAQLKLAAGPGREGGESRAALGWAARGLPRSTAGRRAGTRTEASRTATWCTIVWQVKLGGARDAPPQAAWSGRDRCCEACAHTLPLARRRGPHSKTPADVRAPGAPKTAKSSASTPLAGPLSAAAPATPAAAAAAGPVGTSKSSSGAARARRRLLELRCMVARLPPANQTGAERRCGAVGAVRAFGLRFKHMGWPPGSAAGARSAAASRDPRRCVSKQQAKVELFPTSGAVARETAA